MHMSDTLAPPHDETWKERLGLSNRSAPEFYESAAMVADAPHALAVRTALDELGLSGIFCVQGVPTIGILNMAAYDAAHVINLHGALWNQGLASLLLVQAMFCASILWLESRRGSGASSSTSVA